MQFIKKYFVGIAFVLIVFIFAFLATVIAISPKSDSQNRGFIPCTNTLISDLMECGNEISTCAIKSIFKGTSCDLKVVFKGVESWARGEQERPWSNYIFEPSSDALDITGYVSRESYDDETLASMQKNISQLFEQIPVSDEELQEIIKYYEEHPDIEGEMQNLIKLNKEFNYGI